MLNMKLVCVTFIGGGILQSILSCKNPCQNYIILACVPALRAGKIEKLVWWESTVTSQVIIYVFYTALVPAIYMHNLHI